MNKPAINKNNGLNKPFVLICLFTVSTLAATVWNGDVNAETTAAKATIAAPTQMAGDEGRALPALLWSNLAGHLDRWKIPYLRSNT